MPVKKSLLNRSVNISASEKKRLAEKCLKLSGPVPVEVIQNKTILQDLFSVIEFLPDQFIDLLFIDPPYNMTKNFNKTVFREKSIQEYAEWVDSFISKLIRCLKPESSIYICGDWKSSTSLHLVLSKYFIVRNRITWERDKGRGSKHNWKNNTEDIWFCTLSNDYTFNYEAVKIKRKVLAPYKDSSGMPKDWTESPDGAFRLTHASNSWNHISIPFWSMPENTDHPTQKPEKLLAKIILASSNEGDIVFDPFLGSGTTSVVAKKLNRRYVGVELDKYYSALAEKRLETADENKNIQGLSDGVFWERNSFPNKNVKR